MDMNVWSLENLEMLQTKAQKHGLTIYGIENFNPAHWYDVLLDGPLWDEQIEHLKMIIRTVAKAGIKSIGYNFSLAGVWGHSKARVARGNALATYFDASKIEGINDPIPLGQVWNMTFNSNVKEGAYQSISSQQLWARLEKFLNEVLPVAEQVGVELALHPDDPPMPSLRDTPRLVYQPDMYKRLLQINNSSSNKVELCLGSIQEMSEGSVYEILDDSASLERVSYIHFRNVIGKVPKYREVFIDEGDIDVIRCINILRDRGFEGVIVPDHTPLMGPDDSWETGMAYALGFLRALIDSTNREVNNGMEKR